MSNQSAVYPWFAVQVRGRYETTTAGLLDGKGYETFLPLHKCRRRWSDRIKEIELPLFPGYLFCRFDIQRRLPILITPGVLSIVGIAKIPVPVDEGEIMAIQSIVKAGLQTQPCPYQRIGQRVRIDCGPLCGLEGIIENLKSKHRLMVSVTLLQRSVAVEIDEAWVSAVSPSRRPGHAAEVDLLSASSSGHSGMISG